MCGFIAQLVENRTGIAEVMGSNPVEALIFFFQASTFQFLKLEKFTAMITLHFQVALSLLQKLSNFNQPIYVDCKKTHPV